MSGQPGSSGRITRGIAPLTTVQRTLEFVVNQLPAWRDMPHRAAVQSEQDLNSQLCKFLNAAARTQGFDMAYFHHEERQAGRHRVDLSALSLEPDIEGRLYSYDLAPFLVFEGKRLPPPSRHREREYVTGSKSASGGIQRYKLGSHGASLTHAAMIGYVQRDSFVLWFIRINTWIDDLVASGAANWSISDHLNCFSEVIAAGTARSESTHLRINSVSPEIHLTHLWVAMK